MYVCPRCGHRKEFFVKTVERHYWRVDGEGNLIEDLECYDCEVFEVECPACGASLAPERFARGA